MTKYEEEWKANLPTARRNLQQGIAPTEEKVTLDFAEFQTFEKLLNNAGKLKLTKEQREILYAEIKDEEIEIRPDGIVYLPFIFYAERLFQAFGSEWAMVPLGNALKQDNHIMTHYALVIKGIFIGDAYGDIKYYDSNQKMSYADCIEGSKSECLRRLCKAMGIGLSLWKPEFIRKWKENYAVSVWDSNKKKHLWFKKGDSRINQYKSGAIHQPAPKMAVTKPVRAPKPTKKPRTLKDDWQPEVKQVIESPGFKNWCKEHKLVNMKEVKTLLLVFHEVLKLSEIDLDMFHEWQDNIEEMTSSLRGGKTSNDTGQGESRSAVPQPEKVSGGVEQGDLLNDTE